jgi:hypothetical protein
VAKTGSNERRSVRPGSRWIARLPIPGLALGWLLATPLFAQSAHPRRITQPPPPAFEFCLSAVYTSYEEDVDLDDEVGFGARFGYLFTPRHEIEFVMNSTWTNDVVFPGIDVFTFNFQTAYVHNFTSKDVVPYLTAGIGWFTTDDESLGHETDFALGLGGGIRFFMGHVAYLRIEYRFTQFEGDLPVYANGVDVSVSEIGFGLGWRFPIR